MNTNISILILGFFRVGLYSLPTELELIWSCSTVPQAERMQLRIETLVLCLFFALNSHLNLLYLFPQLSDVPSFLHRLWGSIFEKQNIRFKPQPSKSSHPIASWRKPAGWGGRALALHGRTVLDLRKVTSYFQCPARCLLCQHPLKVCSPIGSLCVTVLSWSSES